MNTRETATTWTPARLDTLRRLWMTDLSMSQIAAHLNQLAGPRVTKSSVSGKSQRLNLPPKPIKLAPGPAPKPKKRPRKTKRVFAPVLDASAPTPLLLTMDQLDGSTCRFPIGYPARYCGHQTGMDGETHRTYCDHHHEICHTKPRDPVPRKSNRLQEYTAKLNFAVV